MPIKGDEDYAFAVGGIVGKNSSGSGYVVSCCNTGAVAMTDSNGDSTGGIVGFNEGIISSCYNAASVSGGSFFTGGVIGELGSDGTANMSYCLNATDGGTDTAVGYRTVGTDVKALSKAAMTNGTMLKDLNTAVDSYNSTKPEDAPTAKKFKAGTGGWPVF